MPSIRDLVEKHLANDLDEFKGLRISGSIPVRQELINELLAELVQNGIAQRTTNDDMREASLFGINDALRLVKHVEIKTSAGSITVEFELRV